MIIRLFCAPELSGGQIIELTEKQCNYLGNVLRLRVGDCIQVFDGKNGEFKAEIIEISRKKCVIKILEKIGDFLQSPDVWLLFAPLKKDCTDMVIQKAVELGVRKICPVITEYTNSEKIRLERLVAQSVEAAEQCRRQDVPQLIEAEKLEKMLQNWPQDRVLFFLNEKGNGGQFIDVLRENKGKAGILIGPEGGFSNKEVDMLLGYSFVKPVSLGKRILRAETAAIAALSCWQAVNGDW